MLEFLLHFLVEGVGEGFLVGFQFEEELVVFGDLVFEVLGELFAKGLGEVGEGFGVLLVGFLEEL